MDFTFPQHNHHGILNGDDLKFFYYDIGEDNLQGWPDVYDWNSVIIKFFGIIDIDTCDNANIPSYFKDNFIRFSIDQQKDNSSVASAFFRHLKNAFSHYRIVRMGDWHEITDKNLKGDLTFRGKVKADLLKEFCFLFFAQREKIINSQDNPNKLQDHE